jgi:hypothetical protein
MEEFPRIEHLDEFWLRHDPLRASAIAETRAALHFSST